MKQKHLSYWTIILLYLFHISCAQQRINDSKKYYEKNSKEIANLVRNYKEKLKNNDFAFGFLDSRYKNYSIQLYIDSFKYIYKSDFKRNYIFDDMFENDTIKSDLKAIAQQVKAADAIWIDKEYYYFGGIKQRAITISFKAQFFNKPFMPSKFYVILFLDEPFPPSVTNEELHSYGIYQIAPKVYHTLSSKFR